MLGVESLCTKFPFVSVRAPALHAVTLYVYRLVVFIFPIFLFFELSLLSYITGFAELCILQKHTYISISMELAFVDMYFGSVIIHLPLVNVGNV